jgi:excisionase family DNA binding protein
MAAELRAELVKIPACAEILGGVSRPTIYALIDSGEIVRVHLGRRALITRGSIDAYIERLQAGPAKAAPPAKTKGSRERTNGGPPARNARGPRVRKKAA